MSKDDDIKEESIAEDNSPEVNQELSQVATNPKQNILILAVICAVFLYVFFNFFINNDDSDEAANDTPIPTNISKPVNIDVENDIPSIPTLPSPPKLEDPTPPPPPETEALPVAPGTLPVLPTTPELPISSNLSETPTLPFGGPNNEDARKRNEAKRKSSIVLIAGTPITKTPEQVQQEADFKYRGDMNLVLGRGKMLDAIIETAINTDFGGEIRAVINRDIYSEWGKNILLPKGSRVFGNYTTSIDGAYGRIAIAWTRIDLANGYTLNLSGTGTDALGKKGNQGRVDNKFKERFSNAILRSVFNVMLAKGLDSVIKPQISSQAAANQSQIASNVKTIATNILLGSLPTPQEKREKICLDTRASITDKTSTIFTTIEAACKSLPNSGATEAEKLSSLMSTINSSSDALVQNTTSNVEESKAQAASKQAFTDLSDTVKTLVEEQEFKPTITIDQGTAVKIYVNRDYKFPKAAVTKPRKM